jgi:hypothetical protein
MSKFRSWYTRHQDAITWWIIGFWTATMIDAVAKQNWSMLALGLLVVVSNWFFYSHRLVEQ